MTPNLQPGKTAVLLVFQGKGAAAARKKHFGPTADPGLPVLLEGGVQRVHMCIWVVSCIIEEICDKKPADATASLKGLFNNIGKILYQNKQLSLQRRAELFRTLMLSKYVYGCDSWTLMEQQTRHFVHTSLMKLYRRLLPHAYHTPYSDEEVLFLRPFGSLPATAIATSWRSIFLFRFCTMGPHQR